MFGVGVFKSWSLQLVCSLLLLLGLVSCAKERVAGAAASEFSIAGASITYGLGSAEVENLFPQGGRVAPLGTILDEDDNVWSVPADVNYLNQAFPLASDLYHPYDTEYSSEAEALRNLDSANIIEIDSDGELVTAYVYADNYFELYINGIAVGKDPIPFTQFNSNIMQFRVSLPFTAAFLAVDWEENIGTGTEFSTRTKVNRPGGGGLSAVFKDASDNVIGVTDGSWRVQTFYISPITDLSCIRVEGTQRLSSECATTAPADLSTVKGVHWPLDENWNSEEFDDSHWPLAITYTEDEAGVGRRPSYMNFTDLFRNGDIIWTSNMTLDNEVIARKVITR